MYADMQQLFGYKYVTDVYCAVIYSSNVITYSSTNWPGDLTNSVVCSAWRERVSGIILCNNNGKLSRACMHLSMCVSTACYTVVTLSLCNMIMTLLWLSSHVPANMFFPLNIYTYYLQTDLLSVD